MRWSRAAVALALATAVNSTLAATTTITVNNTQIGVTPRYLGLNMGHYMPASNTTAWVQYSGINAMRVWASANDYEGSDDIAPYGDNVTTQTQFESRKASLRANPESSTYTNWSQFNDRFANMTQSGRNHVKLNTILGELKNSGVEPILNLTRSENYANVGWGGKWEQWQFTYAMAYHAAKNYDVQRFQWYNEPDQNASTITVADYADRLRVTSDAVRSAVADVNTLFGKSLKADLSAPTTKNGSDSFDTWGPTILAANRTKYDGTVSPTDIFNTYDLHRYNATGPTFAGDINTLETKIPQHNASGAMMPVTYTEFNRYNSSTFADRSDSLDTPQVFSEYAGIYVGAMSENVKGLYAFKFSQTVWDPGNGTGNEPMKTGHYYVSDTGSNNITGATQGAEVARLIAKGFKGELPRLSATPSGSTPYNDYAAAFDAGRQKYNYLSVNRDTSSANRDLNFAAWNIAPGQIIGIQEVSAASHGHLTQYLTVPANGVVNFIQPSQSVWLLTVPNGAAQTQVDLNPTADASVNHALPTANFGLLTTASIDRNATTTADDAAYMKFNLAANPKTKIDRAFLRVTGKNGVSSNYNTVHVYGILDDSWTESGINWNNAPNLAGASDAALTNVGTSAFPVGQLTWNNSLSEWGLDVTEFVRKHPDADLSFVLIREERFIGDADTMRVDVNTREALTGKPRLSLMLTDKPIYYWNANANNAAMDTASNWDVGSAPTTAGDVAVFGDFQTADHVVTTNTNATVGELRFNNLNRYILFGTGTLTLNGGSGAPAVINVYHGDHSITTPVVYGSATTINVGSGASFTFGNPASSGTAPVTKTGDGTLVLGNPSPSFSGGMTINAGRVRIPTVNANYISGMGTGSVVVNNATLELENISLGAAGFPGPNLTLNNGATLAVTGAAAFSKSGSPMIGIDANVTISTTTVTDTLTVLSAFRQPVSGASNANVTLAGPGRVILQSGGLSASTTYAGSWIVSAGSLQLGPTLSSGVESLNAPGFKNGDANQGNTITVHTGGTLLGAVNTPQNVTTTPNYFRADLVMNGGKLATTGVASSNWGGDFANQPLTSSTILAYDPLAETTARDVNLVASASTGWAGTVVVSPGSLANGGAFSVNRSGGTVAVASGSLIQINAGAKLNLGGSVDALSDGVDHVDVVNNAMSGFNISAGVKNVGSVTGTGTTTVAASSTLVATHLRQTGVTISGVARVRADSTNAGVSKLSDLTINAGAHLDLTDNKLIVSDPIGSLSGSTYTGVTGLIASGRNGGSWNGPGLVTSQSQAFGDYTTLAIARASDIGASGTWAGLSVTSSDTLVMYTYGGDANLSGNVDVDDYGQIDFNAGIGGVLTGWFNGDFDYSGIVDVDDYGIIDFVVNIQGAPFSIAAMMPEGMTLSTTPEPSSLGLFLLGGCATARCRRRR